MAGGRWMPVFSIKVVSGVPMNSGKEAANAGVAAVAKAHASRIKIRVAPATNHLAADLVGV
jgi:hypothetical protein